MNHIPLIIWIIGIVFSAGAVYSTLRISMNDIKHIKICLDNLKNNDNKQNEELAVMRTEISNINKEIERLRDKFNGN